MTLNFPFIRQHPGCALEGCQVFLCSQEHQIWDVCSHQNEQGVLHISQQAGGAQGWDQYANSIPVSLSSSLTYARVALCCACGSIIQVMHMQESSQQVGASSGTSRGRSGGSQFHGKFGQKGRGCKLIHKPDLRVTRTTPGCVCPPVSGLPTPSCRFCFPE